LARSKNEIRSVEELPSWFDRDAYEDANTLTYAGWHLQLKVRSSLKSWLDMISRVGVDVFCSHPKLLEDHVSPVFEKFRARPIVDVGDHVDEDPFARLGMLGLPNGHYLPSVSGVRSLRISDIYRLEQQLTAERRLRARAKFDYMFAADSVLKGYSVAGFTDEFDEWLEMPLDDERRSIDQTSKHLMVDLRLPDEILVENFKRFLHAARAKPLDKGKTAERRRKPNLKKWLRFGVLPYIDLKLWETQTGQSVPNRVIADAIFEPGTGGEEVVRKTTAKLANEALSEANLSTLASLASLAARANAERNQTRSFPE